MEYQEPKNLCKTCMRLPECFQQGIFQRENCDKYQPLSLDDLADRDECTRVLMVGNCPKCGSENTYDCENPLELIISDNTVGHCLDCSAYWCLGCDFVFRTVKKGMECPHWGICAECSDVNGYLLQDEFIEKICPTCEHYDNGCQLEDPLECEKAMQYRCPFEFDLAECPKIKDLLERNM